MDEETAIADSYAKRQILLDTFNENKLLGDAEFRELSFANQLEFDEQLMSLEDAKIKKAQDAANEIRKIETKSLNDKLKLEQSVQSKIDSMKSNSVSMGLGLLHTLSRGHKDFARGVIVIEKSLAIAEAIQNTAVATTAALKLGPIAGPPAAAAIQTMGNIQVGLIAATGLASMKGAGGGSIGSATGYSNNTSYEDDFDQPTATNESTGSQIVIRIVGNGDFKDLVVKSIEAAEENDEIRILKG